jgi:VWFA-related protein
MRETSPAAPLQPIALALAATLAAIAVPAAAQQPQFEERVDVVRVILEMRVVDAHGAPVTGLGLDDFAVTVGGKPAPLETAAWVGTAYDREAVAQALLEDREIPVATPRPGRLIVLLYQLGWDRSRLVGHVRMGKHIGNFLDTLAPEDRVAVLAFGSQLRMLLDFTSDREAIDEAVRVTSIHRDVGRPRDAGSPPLSATLDWRAAEAAATPEAALYAVGRALQPIPGPKTVLWIGWGLGTLHRTGITVETTDYGPSLTALARAHATVFTLDITEADYHSLEEGLKNVADDTGGTYAKTHLFPDVALEMLERTLAGHYELVFPVPEELPAGVHEIKVALTKAKGRALYNELLDVRR